MWRDIAEKEKEAFNSLATHPLQSYEWGEFREKTGITVIRRGFFEANKLTEAFQLTLHPIPHTSWNIGYLPKGIVPTEKLIEELKKMGRENNCIFIQLEPNLEKSQITNHKSQNWNLGFGAWDLRQAAHPLFTKYTFVLDLTKSEEELLKQMHPKTRYNIKVAKKYDVKIIEDNSPESFDAYWYLMEETTKRQKFYAHTKKYHQTQFETFPHIPKKDSLSSHLFIATHEKSILTAMLFFVFQDTLYYPYGASSDEKRNMMHSTLTMWEAIRFGKKLGLKRFDMWGALSDIPDEKDSWFGFHRFKKGFGPAHVEFVGSYDLVINPLLYQGFKIADKLRWFLLQLRKSYTP